MTSTPAGWYPDTTSPPTAPLLRWWDGAQWTEHVAPAAPVAPAPAPGSAAPTTPDGVAVASWGRRLGAYLLDSLFTSIVGIAASIWFIASLWRSTVDLLESIDPDTGELPAGSTFSTYYPDFWPQIIAVTLISFGFTVLYHALFLRLWSTTPGKRILKLTVRRWAADGPLDWWTVLKRVGTQYVIFGVLSVVYLNLLDGLWPLWDPRRQALHDKVADTVVVDMVDVDTVPEEKVTPGGGTW